MSLKFIPKYIIMVVVSITTVAALKAQQKPVKTYQVGPDGMSSIFSFYNTTPESPDGKTIAYVRCVNEPSGDGDELLSAAELWVCDRNLKKHRKITGIQATSAHNGVEAQWVDNSRIALFDSGRVRLIDVHSGKDLLKKQIKADGLGHYPFGDKILYNIYTDNGRGAQGIYELDCNTQQVRLVLSISDCAKQQLPGFLQKKDIAAVANWRPLHSQYSPDGKKIAFRLDIGPSPEAQLQGICNSDGSRLKIMIQTLHSIWYDNESMIGHLRFDEDGKRPKDRAQIFTLVRVDLEGNVIQRRMTPRGNHLALSPDRKWFASETFYETNPVVFKLYLNGHPEGEIEIAKYDPLDVTWKRRFHVNPAFSRDGKRIYFSKPLNGKYNGIFYSEIE